MRYILYIILIPGLCLLFSCKDDFLVEEGTQTFNKAYYAAENIEAVDFIRKPDGGFLILANAINLSDIESNIYLINTDASGYQDSAIRIATAFYEKGVTLKLHNNDFYVMGIRRDSLNPNRSHTILFKTDLDGSPVKAQNDTSSAIAEIKILESDTDESIRMNDFLIDSTNIYFVGSVNQGNVTSEIFRAYNFDAIDFNTTKPLPDKLIRRPNYEALENSVALKIIKEPIYEFSVIGQNISNINELPSKNIFRKITANINSPVAAPALYLRDEADKELQSILQYEPGGDIYYAGRFSSTDSLFLIRSIFENPKDDLDSVYRTEIRTTIKDYGNKVVGLTKSAAGNVIMATVEERGGLGLGAVQEISHLLKFSPSGDSIGNQGFELYNSRFFNIKKIMSGEGSTIYILSDQEFENNSTAVGLMKINF